MGASERQDRLTEKRLDSKGRPRLYSRMSKDERAKIVLGSPPGFIDSVQKALRPQPNDLPNCTDADERE